MRNYIKFAIILVLFTAPFSAYLTATFAASSPQLINYTWGSIGTPIYATPGMNDVPFTIQFNSTTNINYAELTLTSTPIISQTGSEYAYAAPNGVQNYLTFYLDIPANATPGSYSAGLQVILSGDNIITNTVNIVINPPALIGVSAPASNIVAGGSVSFPVTITNKGNSTIYALSVTPTSSYLQLVLGNTSSLTYLAPNKTAVFTYDIFAPSSLGVGLYPVSINVQYNTGDNQVPENVIYYTYLTLTSVSAVSVKLMPSTLYYQRNNSLILSIRNNVKGTLNDVIVNLNAGNDLYIQQGTGPFHFGNMQADSISNLSLNVIPTISSQITTIPIVVTVSYNQANTTEFNTFNYNLLLTGNIVISFSAVTLTGTAYNGTTLTISGSLLNSGTEEAYYGTLYVTGQIAQTSQPSYIGDLPTDSPTPFSTSFIIPNEATSGNYPITLVYVYQDPLGVTYNATYPLVITVISGALPIQPVSHRFNYVLYIVLPLVIILILITTFIIHRRRSRAKRESEI